MNSSHSIAWLHAERGDWTGGVALRKASRMPFAEVFAKPLQSFDKTNGTYNQYDSTTVRQYDGTCIYNIYIYNLQKSPKLQKIQNMNYGTYI